MTSKDTGSLLCLQQVTLLRALVKQHSQSSAGWCVYSLLVEGRGNALPLLSLSLSGLSSLPCLPPTPLPEEKVASHSRMSATRATKQSQQSQQRKRKSSATSTLSDAAPVAVRAKKAASAAAAAAVPAAPVILSAVAARKLALAEAAAVAAAAAAAAATDPVVEEASVDKRKGKAPRAAEDSPDNSSDEGDAVSENGIDLDGLGTNAATVLSTDMPCLQHGSHASAVKIVSGGSKPRYFQAAPDSDSDSDSDADSDAQEVTLASDLPAQGSRAARLTLDSTDKSAAEETEAESIASASSRKGRGSPRKDGSRTGRKRRRGNNGDDSG